MQSLLLTIFNHYDFNVWLLYYADFNVYDCVGCISWLIKVANNNDARWKPEINSCNVYGRKGLEFILRLLYKIHFNRMLNKTHFLIGCEAIMDANVTIASNVV